MPTSLFKDIRELASDSLSFRTRLESIKQANVSPDFGWYPYDSLKVFPVLVSMLRDERRQLLSLAGSSPVLDIGCGDGDLSFFFESLGCRALAIDNPVTSYNRTLGFQSLKSALASSVELEVCDLDAGLDLSGRTFGLTLCLGLLYHLKNPYGFLERLARHTRYCLLSTRIAQVTGRGTSIADEPIAYMLNTAEANDDPTNYWIFSEAGLRRILDRTGWDVCDYQTTGCQSGSDPTHPDRDQRAFCMLRSKLADPSLSVELDGGWHEMEMGSWRWTKRVFSVRLKPNPSASTLRFRFSLPEEVLRATGAIRMEATVSGVRLPGCEYRLPGEHEYVQRIPPAALADNPVRIHFELDRALEPAPVDGRELGVQVIFWSIGEVPMQLFPISLS